MAPGTRKPCPFSLLHCDLTIRFFGGVHAATPVSARRRVGRLLSARAPYYRSRRRGDDRRPHQTDPLLRLRRRARVQGRQGAGAAAQSARRPCSPRCSMGCRVRSRARLAHPDVEPDRRTTSTKACVPSPAVRAITSNLTFQKAATGIRPDGSVRESLVADASRTDHVAEPPANGSDDIADSPGTKVRSGGR